jgi:NADH-quinone oxidoreductase subunit L
MILLILSPSLIVMLIGWESVGICSFLLINFWSQRQEAGQSALKAVLFNKIGDLGFLLILIITFFLFKDSSILLININLSLLTFVELNSISLITILNYSILLAAFGKSAQFFFHLWLTDAMEGPTPVSGLIHSATMVIAGVFLCIQLFPLLKLTPVTLLIIMLVGTISALFTSLAAVASFDIKRIIANSTASHISLMFMALGLGDLSVSLFHLTTHAYFKAFGFLFAGYLIHIILNEQDCRKLGGVLGVFPIISILSEYWYITMLNLPNLSSYYSKELFFSTYWSKSHLIVMNWITLISFLLCFMSFLFSAAYVASLIIWLQDSVTFSKKYINELYEVNWLALIILVILALFSQVVGFLLNILFNSQFSLLDSSSFYFISDWNESSLLLSSFIIISFTLSIEFLDTINPALIKVKPSSSFFMDSLLNWSLYNSSWRGFNFFISLDNFIVETSSFINYYKQISYYLQSYLFNKFILQLYINFIISYFLLILLILYI